MKKTRTVKAWVLILKRNGVAIDVGLTRKEVLDDIRKGATEKGLRLIQQTCKTIPATITYQLPTKKK